MSPLRPTVLLANHAGDDWSALADLLATRALAVRSTTHLRETLRELRRDPPDLLVYAPLLREALGGEESRLLGQARGAPLGLERESPRVPLLLVLGENAPLPILPRLEETLGVVDDAVRRPLETEEVLFKIERILRDVETLRRLRRDTIRDHGTGLYNRRHLLDERLPEEVQRARRRGHPLSLLLVDLDDFKRLNTETSYLFADAVLAAFARRLLATKRKDDAAFRYAGDEFVVLLPETGQADAVTAAHRVRDAARQEFHLDDGTWRLTVSVGVATYYPPTGETSSPPIRPTELLEWANRALLQAKRTKDTVRVYREGDGAGPGAPPAGEGGGPEAPAGRRKGR